LRAKLRTVGDAAVLALSGRIAIGIGDSQLTDTVSRLLDGGARRIVVDLQKVSYMDSSGLGALVACRRTAEGQGVPLVLLRPTGKVHDLLQLTGLTQLFRVYEDEGESLARE